MHTDIVSVRPIIGMEIHVELATRTKAFTPCPSPAAHQRHEGGPNLLVDPIVLGLPGSMPVLQREAVELALLVGLALGCDVGGRATWDRKHYTYPDLPKGYQISQLDEPVCRAGTLHVPLLDTQGFFDLSRPSLPVRILRAHLEEDAGKLLHEAPGGGRIEYSIVDYDRAGTPLLEIVSAPDLSSADHALAYARLVRGICVALGATHGVMQEGHVRLEPNINCELTLSDGTHVRTPITEIKNLNSFRALRLAIEHETREQPQRWLEDRRVHAPGAKTTRGWDDARETTFVQRDKEEAQDYRYLPDPDLPPIVIDEAMLARVRTRLVPLPLELYERFVRVYALAPKEASSLIDDPADAARVETIAQLARDAGLDEPRAGKLASTLVLQWQRSRGEHAASLDASLLAQVVALRAGGEISAQNGDVLLDALLTTNEPSARALAERMGLLALRDTAALDAWIQEAINAQPQAASDVRAGKQQALGRLVGDVMKRSGGRADAASVRERLLAMLST